MHRRMSLRTRKRTHKRRPALRLKQARLAARHLSSRTWSAAISAAPPPRPGAMRRVSFESRYGTCERFSCATTDRRKLNAHATDERRCHNGWCISSRLACLSDPKCRLRRVRVRSRQDPNRYTNRYTNAACDGFARILRRELQSRLKPFTKQREI
eukprot:6195938-Pleurochrysis_carterae.AAC.1